MKVALVYDRVNKWGGAERVLLALHRIFPDAPLFTSVYNSETADWAKVFEIHTSFLQDFPFAKSSHEWYAPLMPLAFESFSFDGYDLVISVTSEAAKGIFTKPTTKHLCICLTPTRYLWSGYTEYIPDAFLRFLFTPLVWYLQVWDKIAAQRPDALIAISREVKERIRKYYGRESEVIYPPITLKGKAQNEKRKTKNEYFLVVSRLSRFTKYKRVDLAIAAANQLKIPLKIVGDGDIAYFKKNAGPTIQFLGKVSDEELMKEYAQCKALIFPGVEDFGLAMVEAQAAGKPVIAYKEGGALEIIREGKTGVFFDKQTVESLVDTLKNFHQDEYNSNTCRENALKFSFSYFEKSLKKYIQHI